mmetsp:Transcript_89909/g.200965  ORF Transcript_89909/g.200965 Transcript_89909/m.200965 type:complete len:369 (+) Transcript_89909:342-1448(+)
MRLEPPLRSMRKQFCIASPTYCMYSKLMISSMRTVALRCTEGSAMKASSARLRSYSSPCQLFGTSVCEGADKPSTFNHCGVEVSKGEPKGASTPLFTKPLMPPGLLIKRWPLACKRLSSKLAALRRAAATTFLGARGLPATTTEKAGSLAPSLNNQSTASCMSAASTSSGASSKRQAHPMTLVANSSSSGVPKSLPRRVSPPITRPKAAEPPRAATCAARSAASGPCCVTDAGCVCLTSSGSSTGGGSGKPAKSDTLKKFATIFLVSPGVRRSLAAATGFTSPAPTAAYKRRKRAHSCRPMPLQSTISRPGRSRSTPPAPSLQVKPPANTPGAGCSLQRRCLTNASSCGSTSAPSMGPSSDSSLGSSD